MSRKDTRTYSGHWNYYGDEHPGPPPKFPWLRDVIIAAVIGVFLGGAVGFRVVQGYWPYAVVIGVGGFIIHSFIVGIGQIPSDRRQSRSDLMRITIAGTTTSVIAAVTTMILAR